MEAPWNWEWITPGECADYWNDLMRKKTDEVLKNANADSYVGLAVYWGAYTVNDLTEMVFIDPLRLGRGFGDASLSKGFFTGDWIPGVLSDVSRGAAFLPLGKVAFKAISKRIPMRFRSEPMSKLTSPITSHPAVPAAKAGVPATTSSLNTKVAGACKELFEFKDPAPGEGICAFVGIVQALRHTGRIFTKIEHIAKLVGIKDGGYFFERLADKAPFKTAHVAKWLNQLKVAFSPVQVTNVEALMEHAARSKSDGVYVFIVNWTTIGKEGVLEAVGHLMYVGRTAAGEVRIFDRTGHAVRSLAELEQLAGYKNISFANSFTGPGLPLFIPNAKLIEATAKGIKIAGVTFGTGLSIAIPVKVATFMTGKPNAPKGQH